MASPFLRETERSADFHVVNQLGVTVATFGSSDLAFAFITDDAGQRGPLAVEYVRVVEQRRTIRRLRSAA